MPVNPKIYNMRNEIKTSTSGVRQKLGWSFVAFASLGSYSNGSNAMGNLEVILDGYAYAVNSNVSINLGQQIITIDDSDLDNCQRPNGQLPLNNASYTLITNNQDIGIVQFRYAVESRLLFLTSETSNVVCDNGIFVDQIFTHGFEPPDSIFNQDFEA